MQVGGWGGIEKSGDRPTHGAGCGTFQNDILLFVYFNAIQIYAVHVVHESRQCSRPNCKGVVHGSDDVGGLPPTITTFFNSKLMVKTTKTTIYYT